VADPVSNSNQLRVLIFAPTGRDAELTRTFLQQAGVESYPCRDMSDLIHQVPNGCGAILLAEETLNTMSVTMLTELLSCQPFWSEIPICLIVIGTDGFRNASRRLALFGGLGNVTILERPFRPETLVNTVQVALRSRRRQYEVRDLVTELGKSEERYRDLAGTLEAQVKARTAALEELNKELEAFTYTIAHDLRAPLRAQQSFATALLDDYKNVLDEAGRDYAQRISDSAIRLNRLVQDLLAYSRLSRTELNTQSVDLRPLILRICADMEFQIAEYQAIIDVHEFSFAVCGNEAMIETAITNLLSNAMKFCKPGQRPEIEVDAIEQEDSIRLTIQDNGIGIAPEHHQQVFGIFNRLHKVGEYPGTGVGLAIVQKAIDRMGGKVGVESEEGRDSTFWIELPKSQNLKAKPANNGSHPRMKAI